MRNQNRGFGVGFDRDGLDNSPVGESLVIESCLTDAAVSKGDWVMIDIAAMITNGYEVTVIQGTATVDNPIVWGVALEAASAADERIRVLRRGWVFDDGINAHLGPNFGELQVNCANAAVASEGMQMSGTVAGQATPAAIADRHFGVNYLAPNGAEIYTTWCYVNTI